MKRSEMVAYLQSNTKVNLSEEVASYLLRLLEIKGMLPPPNTNKPIPNFYEGKEHGYTFINEWEKDEE